MEQSSSSSSSSSCALELPSIWRPKVLISGCPGVGKTAIAKVLCGKEFPSNYKMTTTAQLFNNKINEKESGRVMEPFVFDLPGDELFLGRRWDQIEKEAEVHLFVYDITRAETLSDVVLKQWKLKIDDALTPTQQNVISILLIGNKTDLASRRAVSTLQGLRASKSLGAEFVELSAKENRVIPQSTEYEDDKADHEDAKENRHAGEKGDDPDGGKDLSRLGMPSEGAVGDGDVTVVPRSLIETISSFFLRVKEKQRIDDGSNLRKDQDLIQLENALNIS